MLQNLAALFATMAAFLGGMYLVVTRPLLGRLDDMKQRLTKIDNRLEKIEERLTSLETTAYFGGWNGDRTNGVNDHLRKNE